MRRKLEKGHRPAACECRGFLLAARGAVELRPDLPRWSIVEAAKLSTARTRWLYTVDHQITAGDVAALALTVLSLRPSAARR